MEPKKLIEVAMPVKEVSTESVLEKSIFYAISEKGINSLKLK